MGRRPPGARAPKPARERGEVQPGRRRGHRDGRAGGRARRRLGRQCGTRASGFRPPTCRGSSTASSAGATSSGASAAPSLPLAALLCCPWVASPWHLQALVEIGVGGLLSLEAPVVELVGLLDRIARGAVEFRARVERDRRTARPALPLLGEDSRKLLDLLAAGWTDAEIGRALGVQSAHGEPSGRAALSGARAAEPDRAGRLGRAAGVWGPCTSRRSVRFTERSHWTEDAEAGGSGELSPQRRRTFAFPLDCIDRDKCIETAERPSAHSKAPHSLTRMSVRVQDGQETQRVDVIELNVGV